MNGIVFPGFPILLQIALRTLAVYGIVLVGVRLSGKREVGQMTPFDLTLLLLLSIMFLLSIISLPACFSSLSYRTDTNKAAYRRE